ncbi:MAG: tetratricopeptide repeat protein [Verrucomicrobia subdivision 3 bacterium]|nr:tetratricopeptide repeat protein [Limisphaerales bacterium]
MERLGDIIRGTVLLLASLLLVGVILWRWLKGSKDEPGVLIFKWILSGLVLLLLAFGIVPIVVGGGYAGAFSMPFVAACGVILAVIWTPNIAAFLARPFGNLIDGGNVEPDPEPLYSVAIARRKQGKFLESIAEIRRQLALFPNDVTGQMLLAEIQADDLHDLQAAQLTIERFCAQEGHAPKNIAYALNALADWQIKLAQDVPSARETLQRLVAMFPGSEEALLAEQRIAHMDDPAYILARGNRPAIELRAGVDNVGLLRDLSSLARPEENPAETAAKYVAQLERYPADLETREKLAVLYAEHYQRLDLAADQLEQIIQTPGQPAKQVAHCLNLLADLQIKCARDYEGAKRSLERIIELFPKFASAENARQRIAHLGLEMKAHEKKDAIKMGQYEQNIGLKQYRSPGIRE